MQQMGNQRTNKINLMRGITQEMSTRGFMVAAKKFGILQLDLRTPVSQKPPEMAIRQPESSEY